MTISKQKLNKTAAAISESIAILDDASKTLKLATEYTAAINSLAGTEAGTTIIADGLKTGTSAGLQGRLSSDWNTRADKSMSDTRQSIKIVRTKLRQALT